MTKPVKLVIQPVNPLQYVKLISGIFSGGLTDREVEIVAYLLLLQKQQKTKFITQEMKERVRMHLEISSQTMHNYWHTLKKKKVVIGKYKNFTFNNLVSNNIELHIKYTG